MRNFTATEAILKRRDDLLVAAATLALLMVMLAAITLGALAFGPDPSSARTSDAPRPAAAVDAWI